MIETEWEICIIKKTVKSGSEKLKFCCIYRFNNEGCTFSYLWITGHHSNTSPGTQHLSALSELWWWCSSSTACTHRPLSCCASSLSSYFTCSPPHVRPTGGPSHRPSSFIRWLWTLSFWTLGGGSYARAFQKCASVRNWTEVSILSSVALCGLS